MGGDPVDDSGLDGEDSGRGLSVDDPDGSVLTPVGSHRSSNELCKLPDVWSHELPDVWSNEPSHVGPDKLPNFRSNGPANVRYDEPAHIESPDELSDTWSDEPAHLGTHVGSTVELDRESEWVSGGNAAGAGRGVLPGLSGLWLWLGPLGGGLDKSEVKDLNFLRCGDCELIESVVPSDELDRASLSAGNAAEAGGGALPGIPGLLLEGRLEKSEPKDLYLRCSGCELSESVVPSDKLDGKSAGNGAEAGGGALPGPRLGCGPEKWDSIKLCLNCECSGCVVLSDELDGKSLSAGNAAEAGGSSVAATRPAASRLT